MKESSERIGERRDHRNMKDASGESRAMLCAREALRFKALDIMLLDLSGYSSFADYFIICSGNSSRQVQGIAENLEVSLKEHGLRPLGVEGRNEGHWVLMDYGDFIVHVFYEPVRNFYDLEGLWSEAKRIRLERESGLTERETGREGDV